MQDDFAQWLSETRLVYDQTIANFYRDLNAGDIRFLEAIRATAFGDNRPWPNTKRDL